MAKRPALERDGDTVRLVMRDDDDAKPAKSDAKPAVKRGRQRKHDRRA